MFGQLEEVTVCGFGAALAPPTTAGQIRVIGVPTQPSTTAPKAPAAPAAGQLSEEARRALLRQEQMDMLVKSRLIVPPKTPAPDAPVPPPATPAEATAQQVVAAEYSSGSIFTKPLYWVAVAAVVGFIVYKRR